MFGKFTISVHKCILAMHSSFFEQHLSENSFHNDQSYYYISDLPVPYDIFLSIIELFYGFFPIDLTQHNTYLYYYCARYFGIHSLIERTTRIMNKHQRSVEWMCTTLQQAQDKDDLEVFGTIFGKETMSESAGLCQIFLNLFSQIDHFNCNQCAFSSDDMLVPIAINIHPSTFNIMVNKSAHSRSFSEWLVLSLVKCANVNEEMWTGEKVDLAVQSLNLDMINVCFAYDHLYLPLIKRSDLVGIMREFATSHLLPLFRSEVDTVQGFDSLDTVFNSCPCRAVVRIQSLICGYLNRCHASLRKNSILSLQSLVRRRVCMERMVEERESVVSVQMVILMMLQRKRFFQMKLSSILIQNNIRKFICQSTFKRDKQNLRSLQSVIHGYLSRRNYFRTQLSIVNCQTIIQKNIYLRQYQQKRTAIMNLQSAIRGKFASKLFNNARESIIFVQNSFLNVLCLRYYQQSRSSLIAIQALIRGGLTSNRFDKLKSSIITLQCLIRAQRARELLNQQNVSIVKLQSAIRSFLSKRSHSRSH
ncbi:hypothetical protein P9112_003489 [Eukaryota sp. TZLM1-RC]